MITHQMIESMIRRSANAQKIARLIGAGNKEDCEKAIAQVSPDYGCQSWMCDVHECLEAWGVLPTGEKWRIDLMFDASEEL